MKDKIVLITGANSGLRKCVASLIIWLAGDGGKDVNGTVISVYGSDV